MKAKIYILLFGNLLIASEIDFEEALQKTLTNNNELKAKKLDIDKSKIDLLNAQGYEFGNLALHENISKTNNALSTFGMKLGSRDAQMKDFGFSVMPESGMRVGDIRPYLLNYPEARTNYETKIIYELPIFTGYKLQSEKNMSILQIKANEAKYNFNKSQLSLDVLKAYNSAVASKYFIEATNKAKKTASSFVYLASEMLKEGLTTKIDLQQAEVYDMKIQSNIIEAKNQYSLAISYLKFLTNDNLITDVKDFKNTTSLDDKIEFLQNLAIKNRQDLKWMEQNNKTAKTKIDFEKSENYPIIGAYFEYGYNDNKFNNLNNNNDYYTVAIGLKYKIFDGLTTSSNIEKAKIDYAKTNYYLEDMKNRIKLDVEKAYLTKQVKTLIVEEKIKAQMLANDILEKSKEMYQNQLITMNELLMQSANEQKAQAETIMAKFELSIASSELQLLIGQEIK